MNGWLARRTLVPPSDGTVARLYEPAKCDAKTSAVPSINEALLHGSGLWIDLPSSGRSSRHSATVRHAEPGLPVQDLVPQLNLHALPIEPTGPHPRSNSKTAGTDRHRIDLVIRIAFDEGNGPSAVIEFELDDR